METPIVLPQHQEFAIDSLVGYSKELRVTVESTSFLTEQSFAKIQKLANALMGQVEALKRQTFTERDLEGPLHVAESRVLENVRAVELRLKFLDPKRMAKTKEEFLKKKQSYLKSQEKGLKHKILSYFKKDTYHTKKSSFLGPLKKMFREEAVRHQKENSSKRLHF